MVTLAETITKTFTAPRLGKIASLGSPTNPGTGIEGSKQGSVRPRVYITTRTHGNIQIRPDCRK